MSTVERIRILSSILLEAPANGFEATVREWPVIANAAPRDREEHRCALDCDARPCSDARGRLRSTQVHPF
jgi:hypothetical protein